MSIQGLLMRRLSGIAREIGISADSEEIPEFRRSPAPLLCMDEV